MSVWLDTFVIKHKKRRGSFNILPKDFMVIMKAVENEIL